MPAPHAALSRDLVLIVSAREHPFRLGCSQQKPACAPIRDEILVHQSRIDMGDNVDSDL